MEAEKAIKSAAEVFLIGLGQLAEQVFTTFGNEAGQMKQSTGMRFVGGGQVEANFAGRADFMVIHGWSKGSVRSQVKNGVNFSLLFNERNFRL